MEKNFDGGFEVKEEGSYEQGIPNLKEIALMHIRKISQICCEEFIKGYWEERPIKVGGGISVMRVRHADQRAVFCNAVDFLVWIITPSSDQLFKDYIKELKDLEDLDKNLVQRKETFRQINEMFSRTNYFDSMTGRTERS